jgi:hypothetical protein
MTGDDAPAEVADGDTATAMPNWFADFLIRRFRLCRDGNTHSFPIDPAQPGRGREVESTQAAGRTGAVLVD